MSTLPAPATAADFSALVEFLGLSDFVDPTTAQVSFPLGVLYPYTADLRRVCDRFADASAAFPAVTPLLLGRLPRPGEGGLDEPGEATAVSRYLAAVKILKGRIDFAPGGVGIAVGQAYSEATKAVKAAGSN